MPRCFVRWMSSARMLRPYERSPTGEAPGQARYHPSLVIGVDGRPLHTLRRKNPALVYYLARRAAPVSRDEDRDTNYSHFDRGHLTDGNTWNIIVSIRYRPAC